MKWSGTLLRRVRQFGVRRSLTIYLVIVIGLVLASEMAIEHMIGQGAAAPVSPFVNALAIAALVGVVIFFIFQGAVDDRERASAALAESEERFRSLTALSADWFWETDAEHRLCWIAGGQSMLKLATHTEPAAAMAVAERLRREVEVGARKALREAQGARRAITLSIGVAGRAADAKPEGDFFEIAERALRRAKSEGRNRVVLG